MTSTNDTSSTPVLRAATEADLPAMARLLSAAGLPIDGVAALLRDDARQFVVATASHEPGEVVAVAGLEVCGDAALLRSVAVRDDWRGHGLGHTLVERIVHEAESRGIHALYLLTTTAEHYFPRFGFAPIARDAVPAAVADTIEFRSACPASATAMARTPVTG